MLSSKWFNGKDHKFWEIDDNKFSVVELKSISKSVFDGNSNISENEQNLDLKA